MSIGIILFTLLIISGIWFMWEFFSFLFRTSDFINTTTRKVFDSKEKEEKDISDNDIQRDENGDYIIEPEFKKEKTPDIQKYIYILVGIIVVLFFLPIIIRLIGVLFPILFLLLIIKKDAIIKFLDDLFK